MSPKASSNAGYNLQILNVPAMENLTWNCPLAEGPAVFTARVLVNKLNTYFYTIAFLV